MKLNTLSKLVGRRNLSRYIHTMHNEPYFLTFEEIGMGLGVTRQRVQQLHAEHLELLDKARKARRK